MRLVLITLLSVTFFLPVSGTAQNLQWFANDHFQLTEVEDDAVLVSYEKQPWEAFTLYVGDADFSKNTVLSFLVQSATAANLRIDLMDQAGNQATENKTEVVLKGGEDFVRVTYDFGELAKKIDLTRVSHFHFYVNPGAKATGELLIKNIQLPESMVVQDTTDVIVFPNPVTDLLSIKTVDQSFDEIIFFDGQGRAVDRIEVPTTNYHEWGVSHLPSGIYKYQVKYQTKVIAVDHLVIE